MTQKATGQPRRTSIIPVYLLAISLPLFISVYLSTYIAEAHLRFIEVCAYILGMCFLFPWLLEGTLRLLPRPLQGPSIRVILSTILMVGILNWLPVPFAWWVAPLILLPVCWRVLSPVLPKIRASYALLVSLVLAGVGTAVIHWRFFPNDAFVSSLRLEKKPPIVILFFDALSLPMVLDETGRINGKRFPNLRDLSENSDWFRNTSSLLPHTAVSVPMMLTGKYLKKISYTASPPPNFHTYPSNLFSLLSSDYRILGFENHTQFCTPSTCDLLKYPRGMNAFTIQLADWATWWLQEHSPSVLSSKLTHLTQKPFNFLNLSFGSPPEHSLYSVKQYVAEAISTLSLPSPESTLYYFHFLAPHAPWVYYPSGRKYRHRGINLGNESLGDSEADREKRNHFFLRYQLQMGFVDNALGSLLAEMKKTSLYDNAWVILLSDHGLAFRPGHPLRHRGGEMLPETFLVPLMIKRPGQKTGRLFEEPVELVDWLPTLLEELGARPTPSMDGQNLYRPRKRPAGILQLETGGRLVHKPLEKFPLLSVSKYYQQSFHSHLDMQSAFGWGEGAERVGTRVPAESMERVGKGFWNFKSQKKEKPRPIALFTLEVDQFPEQRSVALAGNGLISNVIQIPRGKGSYRTKVIVPEKFLQTPQEWTLFEITSGELRIIPRRKDAPSTT